MVLSALRVSCTDYQYSKNSVSAADINGDPIIGIPLNLMRAFAYSSTTDLENFSVTKFLLLIL